MNATRKIKKGRRKRRRKRKKKRKRISVFL